MKKNKKSTFVSRDYYIKSKTINHNAWVFGSKGNDRMFIGLTTKDKPVFDKKTKKIYNVIKLPDNPEPNNNEECYAVDNIYIDNVNNFKSRKTTWKTSKDNRKKYNTIIKKHKK